MKLSYQPHIDGLRALAVLAVIIYHLEIKFFNLSFLPGGFLGVDIFFIISGYLICRIILQELKIRKGKFSFLNFYQRRARRILPALFAVMLFTTPLTFYFLTPQIGDFNIYIFRIFNYMRTGEYEPIIVNKKTSTMTM